LRAGSFAGPLAGVRAIMPRPSRITLLWLYLAMPADCTLFCMLMNRQTGSAVGARNVPLKFYRVLQSGSGIMVEVVETRPFFFFLRTPPWR